MPGMGKSLLEFLSLPRENVPLISLCREIGLNGK